MDAKVLEQNWHVYIDAFNAASDEERRRLLEKSVSEDVYFTNPGGEGTGRIDLHAHIGEFQDRNQGKYFTTDKVYPQKDKLLAAWSMHAADGTKIATGFNFVRPDQQGRFEYMAGFF